MPPRPPGYAFVEVSEVLGFFFLFFLFWWIYLIQVLILQFEDARDAEDAIRGRDGYDFDGHRLRVGGSILLVTFVSEIIIIMINN